VIPDSIYQRGIAFLRLMIGEIGQIDPGNCTAVPCGGGWPAEQSFFMDGFLVVAAGEIFRLRAIFGPRRGGNYGGRRTLEWWNAKRGSPRMTIMSLAPGRAEDIPA
jgi:hypothetical protein